MNRSQWIRRIRDENRKLKEQEALWKQQRPEWQTLVDKSEMFISEADGPERSVHDFHRLTQNRFKKIYYKRDPKDPARIQTIHYHSISSQVFLRRGSNFNYEEPQPDWEETTPQVETSLARYRLEIKPLSLKNMNIRLDAVTFQMLKEVMKKNRQNDAKKFLTEQIRRMYLSL